MSTPVIRIENLGKEYIIGRKAAPYQTLRENLMGILAAPFTRFRRISGRAEEAQRFWALRDINLEVREGEVVGIIGRNGAGKSTLLKILSRITNPTTGRVVVRGRVGSLLEVGTGFHPELTGRENIYLNAAILGMTRKETDQKFDEIVGFSEIDKFLDTPLKRYSSGMYIRLAFSVAAHLEPEILIVDEVLAVGDASFQKKCIGKMENVAGQGRTILFVSHNMAAVQSLCSRLIVIEGGKIIFEGNVENGIHHYLHMLSKDSTRGNYLLKSTDDIHNHSAYVYSAQITSNGKYTPEGYAIGAPLEITVDCNTNGSIRNPSLGIGIDNSAGVRVVTFHTQHSDFPGKEESYTGKFRFVCKVDDLALAPGDYFVKISLESLGGHQPAHVINSAFSFYIAETNFYKDAGRRSAGIVLCRDQWERRPITE